MLNKYRKERKILKMKKNVFSRAIAVLASMTVLGAASMMSASAAGEGVKVADVTVPYGTTEATVGLSLIGDIDSQGAVLTVTYPEELTLVETLTGALVTDESVAGSVSATYVAPNGLKTDFSSITFGIPADAEAGTVYDIGITITSLDNGGAYVESPVAEAGSITIEAEPTEEPTEAPAVTTEAPAVTTAAPATTVAKKTEGSPKTGSAGVAVAVAGLVTAGATAVVLKKKH